jgi:hypothetical protein
MGRRYWTADSSDDYYDDMEHGHERWVTFTCPCGAPVRVPYAEGPPIGPVHCDECKASHPISKWRETVRRLR